VRRPGRTDAPEFASVCTAAVLPCGTAVRRRLEPGGMHPADGDEGGDHAVLRMRFARLRWLLRDRPGIGLRNSPVGT
jgi:hypothetical protein